MGTVLRLIATVLMVSQAQQLPRPTFETGVDLISVDVLVVDKNGKPIVDLKPEDFEIDIGARHRKISVAQFVSYASPATAPGSAAPQAMPSETTRAPRMFVIAIDEFSLYKNTAMAAIKAAEKFIDRLHPDDLVGVIAYPTAAASHALTADHKAVRASLKKVAGLFHDPFSAFNLSPSEALDIANGDQEAIGRVRQRECPRGCQPDRIHAEAVSIVAGMQQLAARSIAGLTYAIDSLKDMPGRKTLVLVSGGLVMTDRFGGGLLDTRSKITNVGREAALANVNVFALHLDWTFIEGIVTRTTMRTSFFRDSNLATSGLDVMAATAGGSLTRVHGTRPDGAFDRILSETSGHYLLGVESVEADRNGEAQPIRVKVKRPGAQVRSRTFVSIPRKG